MTNAPMLCETGLTDPPAEAIEMQPFVPQKWKGPGNGKGPLPAQSRIVSHGAIAWVQLSQGRWAIIDKADVPLIANKRWSAHKVGLTYYATALYKDDDGRNRQVAMHKRILGVGDGQIDHRNLDGLDNRRLNLRRCTFAQNNRNQRRNSRNTTGFKGVHFNAARRTFVAMIRINGRKTYLGQFSDPAEAYRVYCLAAEKHHGEFART